MKLVVLLRREGREEEVCGNRCSPRRQRQCERRRGCQLPMPKELRFAPAVLVHDRYQPSSVSAQNEQSRVSAALRARAKVGVDDECSHDRRIVFRVPRNQEALVERASEGIPKIDGASFRPLRLRSHAWLRARAQPVADHNSPLM
jgi:hypothetical protein